MKDVWHLCRIDWLQELSEEECEALRQKSIHHDYAPGEIVFQPTGAPHSIYLLEKGQVRIYRLSDSGAEMSLGYVAPGEVFGELAAFGDFARESYAVAVRPSAVCKVDRVAFEGMLAARPSLTFEITKQIGKRLKRIENRVEDLVFRSSRARVLRMLMELSETLGIWDGDRIVLSVPLTQEEFATLVGCTRQTVNETLRELQTEGQIEYDRQKIVVLQPEVLQEVARSSTRP